MHKTVSKCTILLHVVYIVALVEIAKATNFTSGKWLIRRPRDKIDETWKLIAEATVAGRLGHLAKVSGAALYICLLSFQCI